ncbi:hypothetical protein ACFXPM_30895 [Streptomyces sp. NPDC059095]|uniref:hypothetical protein n=1 Tax=Streptomyces sp. NPDC059095 TaxID=3346726 RepID=UPI003677DE8D
MESNDLPLTPGSTGPIRRVWAWIRRRRRLMVVSVVRGACYGIGTGLVGLVFWWIQLNL